MKRTLFTLAFCLVSAAAATASAQTPASPARPAPAADPHAAHKAGDAKAAAQGETPAAQKYFTDVELVDQDGKPRRLYSDLLKGKTVVVNAFFTTCTSVCPPMTRNLEKVQAALGERFGRDVFFVSISVDPEVDTPARLKDYAQKFHAKPGWTFVTGKKENVDWALYKLGQYVDEKNDHTTGIIIGNEATGLWKKALGIAPAADLIKVVTSVADDKAVTADAKQN
ncbi:MAG TPA: SCO family protein [Pyrinomonadaceae bacterium]|jgi:protein SCO1/2|nr:SCO family protein [Pyrinomonadaceae bacterium]